MSIKNATLVAETARRCPGCGANLSLYRLYSIEVEGCPACEGVWFDKDELRRLKDRIDRGSWGNLRWMDDELNAIGNSTATRTGRGCPKCAGTNLLAVRFGPTDVVIDCCPACQGFWLDRGELERIVAYLRARLDRLTSADMRAELVKEIKEIWSGPESTLSELLDAVAAASALTNITIFEHPALCERLIQLHQTGRTLGL